MTRGLFALAILCTIVAMPFITSAQAPVANFSASNTSGCSPVVVQFTDMSTNSPTSWYWDLGNGGTSTIQNPSASYITPGTYRVILTATNANGSTSDTDYITVYTSPTVAFSADTTTTCGTKTVSFTNSTVPGAGGSVSYLWDFGDGDSSTVTNPTHTYLYSGSFTVSLVVVNSSGCTSSLTKSSYINIQPKPTASFTANNTSSCNAPFQVTFTNSTTSGNTYEWDFGDGNTSTASNPSHTYTSSGTYSVRLIATGINGCKDTLTRNSYIVIGQVAANFTFSSPNCVGKPITFTNTTTPGLGVDRLWSFGTGATDTAANPVYSYSSTGTYTVTLIEKYANSCNDTISKSITINSNPTAAFATPDTVGCSVPFIAHFTNSSTGATSYTWQFGTGTSGATNPNFQYNSLGIYSVTLITGNTAGCTTTLTKTNYIKLQAPVGTLTVSDTGACANQPIQFTGSVALPLYASNYRWDFGDGSGIVSCSSCKTQSHSYASTGTYNVQLIVSTASGCDDTLTRTIYIRTKPTAAFTGTPTTICPDATVNFTNSSTGATTYRWDWGDGFTDITTSPAHTYNTHGTYSVRLIANNSGCKDTLTRNNYITVNLPIANFSAGNTCNAQLTYNFIDSSVGANSYVWEFGDGNTSTTAGNVSHTYATPGTYNAVLRVTNTSSGCVDTMAMVIVADTIVLPSFIISDSTLCKKEVFRITRAPSTGLVFDWYFGTQHKHAQNLQPQFEGTYPGVFDLKMVVTDSAGCKDSVVLSNIIKVGGATVDFSASTLNPCKETAMTFNDLSVTGAFPVTNRHWDFDDGLDLDTTATTVTHSFNNTGPFDIKLVITDSLGCKDSLTKPSYVYVNKPIAQFYSPDTSICAGDTVQFQNNSGGNSFTSFWKFGDGGTSTNITPAHVYSALGNYTVQLILTDTFGCMDSMTKVDYIKVQQPTAAFTMSDSVGACPPLTVYLTNTTVGGSTYLWTFGNNNQSTNTNASTTYTYPGVYSIQLVATNSAGCKDSTSKNVTVHGPTGSYSYTPTVGCNPLMVNFTAISSNTTSYIWDMNNGFTQTTSSGNFSYTFTQRGKYVPKLILSDGASCQVPLQNTDTIDVDELEFDFSFTSAGTLCNTDTVFFNDTVNYTLSTVSSRSWDFGDGGTSTAEDPSHYYATPGTFQVRLIMSNANGCSDTVTKTVTVHGLPTVTIGSTGDSICPGQPTGVQLTASGASTYAWTPATGLSCSNCSNPMANPVVTTQYIVTGTDTNGCTNNDTLTVVLNPKPVITVSNDTTICEDTYAPLTVSGANTYAWTPATGLSCSNCAGPSASPATTTMYTVIGTNTFGCTDTGNVTVTIIPKPVVDAGADTTICFGDTTLLVATGAVSYAWTPVTALSCAACDSTYAKPATSTAYSVIGTAANGCKDTATVTVSVNPLPNVNAGNDTAICIGASAVLNATGATSYTWTPATGLSCTGCASPTANPTTTTTYIVTGTDGNTCRASDTMILTVNPLPNVNAGNDDTTCIGFGVMLTATGATTYTWTPATGLSCTNCAGPIATPTVTTTYIVTGIDANTCENTDTVVVNVNPQPVVSGGSNGNICPADSAQLQASGAVSYAWSPATGLSCTSCANPKASPVATTTYTVIGTDTNGCQDTATVDVIVNAPPVLTVSNDTALCIGDSITLQANGAAVYTWSPSSGLSCTSCASPKASPTITTTYTVIGANGNSCKDTATVTVTVNPLPNVSAGNDQTVCVGFGATLMATGAVSYTWTPTGGLSCTNCPNPTATPSVTTTYIVTGTDTNTCKNKDTVVVNVNPQPTVSGGSNTNICPADSTQLQATGAVTYVWSPATGLSCTSCANPKASPAVTTTYTVIGTDGNGCKDTATVTVTLNTPPTVSAGNNVSICIGSSTVLQASGAATYAWSPSTGLSCTSCANPTANPTTTTTYTVIGTDANGCKDTATVTVTVNPLPNVNAGSDQTICVGFGVTLTATGATSYTWTPTTGLSCVNCPNPTASPTVTTTYIVTGTDGNGCVNKDTVIVNVNPQPTVGAGGNKTICFADSVQLQGSGATSYLWSPVTGLSCTSCASPKASPATTTTYTVVGTDANGCKDTATATVNVNALPNIDAGSNQAICNGSNVQLTATGGVSYIWTPSTGLSCTNCAAPFASPTTTTLYKVTGTDANGCKNKDSVTVTVNPLPNVSAGSNQSICLKDSAQLAATGAVTYTWTPTTGLSCTNCSSPKASPPTTTVYTVTGTDANGCVNTSTVTVTILPLPPVDAGPDKTICIGDSVQLQVTGATSYQWTPLAGLSCTNCANPKASPAVTTRYIVTGTGTNSCVANDTVFVNVNTLPIVSTGNDTIICRGDTLHLLATGAATYTWSPVKWLSCSNCPNPTSIPDSTVTYLVTGTDINGCKDTADIKITVKPVPVINVTAARDIVCDGDTTQLLATGGNTYTWIANSTLSCSNCPNPVASPKFNTKFVVRGFVNGCSDTASVFINVRPKPIVKAGPDIAFCSGKSDTLRVLGSLSYSWSPATGLSCTNCQFPLASPQQSTVYTVTGTDANGCFNTDSTVVTVYPLPPVNAGPDVTICAGASTKLLAKGAASYIWSPAQGLSCTNCPDPVAMATNTTTYSVSGTDNNGCVNTDDIQITVLQKQPVTYGDDDSICIGQQVTLTATGGTDYEWSPANELSTAQGASTTATPSASTVYRVIIKQGDCFTDTGFITIGVFEPPTVDAGPDQKVSGGTEVHVAALGKGIATYEWSPAGDIDCYTCASTIIRPKRTTTYTVKATSKYGCEAEDDITINVTCGSEQIFVANTFTPNNDGMNDMFFPQGRGLSQVERFSVYSRWGELIFDRKNMPVNDPAAGWNGTFKSEPLKPDVFVYIIRAICENGEPIEIKGDISLVR